MTAGTIITGRCLMNIIVTTIAINFCLIKHKSHMALPAVNSFVLTKQRHFG
jgi:hypothetical protein